MPAFVLDLSSASPTAATVEGLARLALSLKRRDRQLRLLHASPELEELIAFMGLARALGVETQR